MNNNQITTTALTCHNCPIKLYFHTYNCQKWKYYYNKEGQIRPLSDFYQLYCQPPFPNWVDNLIIHCRHCSVYFRHTAETNEEGKITTGCQVGAIYIDQQGLCLECRNKEKHVDHPCLLNPQQRVWGTAISWEGLFTDEQINIKEINFKNHDQPTNL